MSFFQSRNTNTNTNPNSTFMNNNQPGNLGGTNRPSFFGSRTGSNPPQSPNDSSGNFFSRNRMGTSVNSPAFPTQSGPYNVIGGGQGSFFGRTPQQNPSLSLGNNVQPITDRLADCAEDQIVERFASQDLDREYMTPQQLEERVEVDADTAEKI